MFKVRPILRPVHEATSVPIVLFFGVRGGPDAIGCVAAGGRSDEITLAAGTFHLSRPDGHGSYRKRVGTDVGEGAHTLQLVNVEAWGPEVALPVIFSHEALRVAICG